MALVATFLLLSAGMVVSAPGLMRASATSGTSTNHPGNDDGSHNGGDDSTDDCHSDDGHESDDSGTDDSGTDDHSSDDQSSDDQSSTDQSSTDQSGDVSAESVTLQSTDSNSADDSQGNGNGNSNGNDDGNGNDDSHDDGHDDGHHETHDDDDDENCSTTAKLTLNKVVVNDNDGIETVAAFTLVATSSVGGVDVISGPDPAAGSSVGISATVPVSDTYVLSESGPDGYAASAWSCSAGTLTGDTLQLVAGDVANCTITNDDIATPPVPAQITVDKFLTDPMWGGTLVPLDFQLTIDGDKATQSFPYDVSPGTHTIGETTRPGYEPAGTVCVDLDTNAELSTDGTVTVVAGQHVHCIVANEEIPATLTLTKVVLNTNGGHAVASDFQLQIDGELADQNTKLPVKAGPHTISEADAPGYRLVSVVCTDDDAHAPVAYNNGISLALGQDVSCVLTNVSDPVDLVITKSDDGLSHDAGGPAFDYTITVDNLGPRDATGTDMITVTDQLPAGLEFVSFPVGCSAAGQVLTCTISPADLQLADPPVVITVTVKANPDAPSGTYTNMAYVTTADDPACMGTGCVPVCAPANNNVACETTAITRNAGISITKVANVVGPIHPGTTYTYSITVHNPGPSSYPSGNMTMTDDLPAELAFVSVSAPSPWTCNSGDPISCTYGAVLAPNTDAAVVTVTVTLDPNFPGQTVVNNATAIARVEGPSSQSVLLADAAAADPIVVTATDDETTTIVRNANLSIDKSVSQTSATGGDQFNWIFDITNHGPDLATNLVVSDTIPAAFQVIGTFPGAGISCSNNANSVQCTAATLANGATLHAVVQVRVVAGAAPGVVTNTATVVATSTDPDTTDNSDSASITVTAAASQAPVPPAPTATPASSGVSLPRTGNGSLSLPLTLAGLLIAGGTFSLVIARRRRAATA